MSELHAKSLSVTCPICRADRGVACVAPNKPPGVSHVQRTARGVRAAYRGDAEQHARAAAALGRVRVAARRGRPINPADAVTALACVCPDECAGVERLLQIGRELHELGALELELYCSTTE